MGKQLPLGMILPGWRPAAGGERLIQLCLFKINRAPLKVHLNAGYCRPLWVPGRTDGKKNWQNMVFIVDEKDGNENTIKGEKSINRHWDFLKSFPAFYCSEENIRSVGDTQTSNQAEGNEFVWNIHVEEQGLALVSSEEDVRCRPVGRSKSDRDKGLAAVHLRYVCTLNVNWV